MAHPITVAVEGASDLPVVRRILDFAGCSVHVVHGLAGKRHLNRNLHGYNNAARFAPWLVLRDLDHDAQCAAGLVQRLLPAPSKWMRFRVAVREVESWVLADPTSVSRYLRIRQALVPESPDQLLDPKQTLVNLARLSPIAAIRADMVPAVGMSNTVGPAYASRIGELAAHHWKPGVAVENSDSLRRCVDKLKELSTFFDRGGG